MKKKTAKLLSVILALMLIVCTIPNMALTSFAEITSGTCGDNLTWEYDTSTYTLTISGTGAMTGYSSSKYNGTNVTTAPWRSYYDTMKTVIINSGVTSIGWYAFWNCTGLKNITIPDSVMSISISAFRYCTGLTSVTIPDSVTSIESFAFTGCTELTSVTIGSSVTSIKDRAFWDCTGLTSITIPDSVTSIRDYAFAGCTGLTSVTIGNSVTSIGYEAFYGCAGLKSITIPNSVTSIKNGAFLSCTGLTSITIPDSVTSIESFAFSGCTGLTTVNYTGSEEQRNQIQISGYNDSLINANWIYNYVISTVIGDITGDGYIDSSDLALIVNNLIFGGGYNKAYDLNNDGNVNILDLIKMKKQIANV